MSEDTLVAGTSACDARYGIARHWLVDVHGMTLRGERSPTPFPSRGLPAQRGWNVVHDLRGWDFRAAVGAGRRELTLVGDALAVR